MSDSGMEGISILQESYLYKIQNIVFVGWFTGQRLIDFGFGFPDVKEVLYDFFNGEIGIGYCSGVIFWSRRSRWSSRGGK